MGKVAGKLSAALQPDGGSAKALLAADTLGLQ
jgi:hypothetical protein